MKEIFELLCGILYLIGLPFGWSYQETSIYICIYLWPILCCISTFPNIIMAILITIKHKIKGILILFISLIYSFYYIFYAKFFINRYGIDVPNAFNKCMIDLKFISDQLGITYEELNILIYVILFSIIIIINYIIYRILKNLNK